MKLDVNILCKGSKFTIGEIVKDGVHVLKKLVEDVTNEQRTGVVALIKQIADQGCPENESRFVHEEDGIFAIKFSQVRVYCFFDKGSLIFLAEGYIKKTQKADPEKLKRAKKIRKAYLEGRS